MDQGLKIKNVPDSEHKKKPKIFNISICTKCTDCNNTMQAQRWNVSKTQKFVLQLRLVSEQCKCPSGY